MANKNTGNNSRGTWKEGDLRVVEIVYDGKVIKPPKKKPEDDKKKGKK